MKAPLDINLSEPEEVSLFSKLCNDTEILLKSYENDIKKKCADRAVEWLLIQEKPDGSYITQLRAAIMGGV